MIETRTPTEQERQKIIDLVRLSLNLDRARVESRGPMWDLGEFLCAFEGDRLLATAAERSLRQWFGGRQLGMTGVWAVTTLPEVRGAGLAKRLVEGILRRGRERGDTISCLYPAALRPYRRVGFELAGTFTEHRVAIRDLPPGGGPLSAEEYREEDLDAVRECFQRFASQQNGPVDCDDADWWPSRILRPWGQDENGRAVVVRNGPEIEAYAAFQYEKAEGHLDVSFDIQCTHCVARSEAGLRALFAYFHGFRGLGQALRWTGPPADPATLAVAEQELKPEWTFRWMARLLDVPGAFESRGYPGVSGEAVIAVEDALLPENVGPWLIEADAGKVRVSPAAGGSPRPIPIGALSSLFTGFISSWDAVRLGHLDVDDPAVPFLGQLLAGPAPWMIDFF